MNITEDYCSFEVAKLLKDKGMDASCFNHYVQKNNNDGTSEAVTVCTLQMAMKWLRKKGVYMSIDTVISSSGNIYFNIDTYSEDSGWNHPVDFYDSYKEAVEAVLKYSLENLI